MNRRENEKVKKLPTTHEVMLELDEILDQAVGDVPPLTAEEYQQRRELLNRFKGDSFVRDVRELGVNQKFYLINVVFPDKIILHWFKVVTIKTDQGNVIRVEARPLDDSTFERMAFAPNQPVLINVA